MGLRRWVSVLAAASFALQLGLSARGVACVMPSADGSPVGEMAGMDMSGGDSAPAQPADHHQCDGPFAPTDCLSMAPCTLVLIGGSSVAVCPTALPAREIAPLLVFAPPSPSDAPEPPPPKA